MERAFNLSVTVDSIGLWRDGACSVGFWEADIQRVLVDSVIRSTGQRVLEVGFGLGLAHAQLQSWRPQIHIVVEADLDVKPAIGQSACTMWSGLRWQQAVDRLPDAYFEGIVFDPDPERPADLGWTPERVREWAWSGISHLSQKLALGGHFGFLDFTGKALDDAEFNASVIGIGCSARRVRVFVDPPQSCKYATRGWAEVVVVKRGGASQ